MPTFDTLVNYALYACLAVALAPIVIFILACIVRVQDYVDTKMPFKAPPVVFITAVVGVVLLLFRFLR